MDVILSGRAKIKRRGETTEEPAGKKKPVSASTKLCVSWQPIIIAEIRSLYNVGDCERVLNMNIVRISMKQTFSIHSHSIKNFVYCVYVGLNQYYFVRDILSNDIFVLETSPRAKITIML